MINMMTKLWIPMITSVKPGHLIGLISLMLVSWTAPIIELEKRTILNGKVEILIPIEFEIMSEDMMKLKYPSERRPTLVYTDKTGGINIAFNHTASSVSQEKIDLFKQSLVTTLKTVYSSAEWIGDGVKEINGRKVGYMEFVTPAVDTKIYNLMFFTDLEGRLLLSTFNCVESQQKDWTAPAHEIMNSLIVK